jgi:hypothetical protein
MALRNDKRRLPEDFHGPLHLSSSNYGSIPRTTKCPWVVTAINPRSSCLCVAHVRRTFPIQVLGILAEVMIVLKPHGGGVPQQTI